MDAKRVAEIFVQRASGLWHRASGYANDATRVITAKYALGGAEDVRVRFLEDTELRPARVGVRSRERDVAVIELKTPGDFSQTVPSRYIGSSPVDWTAVGFPRAGEATDANQTLCDSVQIEGRFRPLGSVKRGLLQLTVDPPPTKPELWHGLSGARCSSTSSWSASSSPCPVLPRGNALCGTPRAAGRGAGAWQRGRDRCAATSAPAAARGRPPLARWGARGGAPRRSLVPGELRRTRSRISSAIHERLLSAYRDRLPAAEERESRRWAELPRSEAYVWRHLFHHMFGAERKALVEELVTDGHWLTAKAAAEGVSALLDDLAQARECIPGVEVTERALRQDAGWLQQNPTALPGVLYNRLRSHGVEGAEVERLMGGVRPQIRLVHPVRLAEVRISPIAITESASACSRAHPITLSGAERRAGG